MEHKILGIELNKETRNYEIQCSCGWTKLEYYSLISGDTRRIHENLNALHQEHMDLVFALF